MPETASTDQGMTISDPRDQKALIATTDSHEYDVPADGSDSEKGIKKIETNGRAQADAPRHLNGHVSEAVNGCAHAVDERELRPSKRRRTRESTPPPSPLSARKPKPISPPWKKIGAEGPTTFEENGRRKSSRINTLPLELQPPSTKRLTRRSLNAKAAEAPARVSSTTPSRVSSRRASNVKQSVATPKSSARRLPPPPPPPPAQSVAPPTRTSPRSLRRSLPTPSSLSTRHSTRPRRSLRLGDSSDAHNDFSPGPLPNNASHEDRKRRSSWVLSQVADFGFIPLVHPDQVRKRGRISTSFDDFWSRAGEIPVEEGGLYASEDGPEFTDEAALKEAHAILRIEDEVEPGGALSVGKCSLFAPEGEEEPPRQWTRHDHMIKAMSNFRRLLLGEQQRHRAAAKKLAEACRDEWIRRQPKTAEQLELEAREQWLLRYRNVVRALFGTWENVRGQVNRQRLEQWEAEEQRRVKAALNEAVSLSELKLQARRGGLSSDEDDDDEDDDDDNDEDSHDGFDELSDNISVDDGEASEDLQSISESNEQADVDSDSDNMSTSDEDEDEVGDGSHKEAIDEDLTQAELIAKYAGLPDLTPVAKSRLPDAHGYETDPADIAAETSDESVDMDDDLGSSDTNNDGGDEIHRHETNTEMMSDDSEDEDAGGLLGLFFGKSELKQFRQEAKGEEEPDEQGEDVEMEDVSSTSVNGHGDHTARKNGEFVDGVVLQQYDEKDPIVTVEVNALTNGHRDSQDLIADITPPRAGSIDIQATDESPNAQDIPGGVAATNGENVVMTRPVAGDSDVTLGYASPKDGTDLRETEKIANMRTQIALDASADEPNAYLAISETEMNHSTSRPSTTLAIERESGSRSVKSGTPSANKTEIPFLLRGMLREYQHDGLDWLAGLYANKTNGILADEMGLGKTIQTIALLAHLACYHQVWGPHLVIVPTSVMLNWEMEFKKWCPGFKILAYYGTQEERKKKRQGWSNDDVWNVCITSYQLVLQDQQVFKRRRWHFMVLDEAHNIKNFKSQRWQTLLGFNTQARLLLTGTPLQNNLTELWSLLFFLMPAENGVGGFADLQEFQDWFHKPESQILESGRDQMDEEAKAIITKLHKVLRPYLLRRLKADVEKQMPAKYEHVEFCRLSKRQRELYDGFLSRTDTKETLSSGNYLSIINCLMQLRKVCNHPDLFIDRPIMTSFRMSKSVAAEYTYTEQRIRSIMTKTPMAMVDLNFLNMVPTRHEHLSSVDADRIAQLSPHRTLMDLRESQKGRAQAAYTLLDPTTVASSIAYLEGGARWGRFEELQHCLYLNALRRQQRPIYGSNIIDLVSVGANKRPFRPKPKIPSKIMSWVEGNSALLRALTPTLDQRATDLKTTITKFSCITPAVVTRDLQEVLLGRKAVQAFTDEDIRLSAPVRWAPFLPKESPVDPWHEARMTHSIHFPDKRLLQYDCGKLQVLDRLLRKLQTGGHRALIFTQMTKVLDILEQFLNIHGHKYLRLDGATKVEQRQILTDRFNNDPRILCFILSTRSGGLGINLTGADTVIFYDQDWNPAMDKQCQDRCHRIGQTRDVHIYRLVSEHTIEANILRKASQKQMLDDVVIQEGEFTTDYFNRVSVKDVLEDKVDFTNEGVAAADAALDRVLGGPDTSRDQRTVGRALAQAEDREDVAAARVAEREIEADDEDFTEKVNGPASGTTTARQGTPAGKSALDGGLDPDELANVEGVEVEHNAWGQRMGNIDEHMLRTMTEDMRYTKLELPKDKKKGKKKGRDTRKR
ncbi:helicase SWR1 [Moelleriella libera RCEF 2490]|uniref:DNA helicase n=1 Tax=Moelleriella libera RCEF 2490 TaxID=1081109 RepID=A0A166PUG8_9HYPO|nr:helicase SWR1 [Moelleriella libera RCEF 2490]